MINGIGSQPFSARTIPPLERPEVSSVQEILKSSREQFGRPRQEVEDLIRKNLAGEEAVKASPSSTSGSDKPSNNNGFDSGRPRNNIQNNGGEKKKDYNENRNSSFRGAENGNKKNADSFKPRQNKVIDEKTRIELEKALHQNSENESKDESKKNESFSLIEMADNTKKNETPKRVDDKGPKIENTNALRDALAEAMKKKDVIVKVEENQKKVEVVAPENKSTTEIKTEIKTEVKTEFKNNFVENKNKQHQEPKSIPVSEPKKEIPERELKQILGVE